MDRPATHRHRDEQSAAGDEGKAAAPRQRRGVPSGDEPQDQRPPWYRRPRLVGGLGVIALALVIGGILWWLYARRYESTDDAFIDAHFARVSARVSGRVLEVPVDDNQFAAFGQTLVRLDPADFQAKMNAAEAGRAEAEGRLAQEVAQQAVDRANLEQDRADARVAEANDINARADLERYQRLARSAPEAVSRQQLDNALAAGRSAAARLDSALKKVQAAEAQVLADASRIRAAQAALKSAEAQLELARLALSYTTVRAPDEGHVTRKTVARGDYVQAGQDLMALVPTAVWVTANFKETQLDHMRPGQKAEISIDAYPDLDLHGHVDSIQRGSGPAFSLLPPENATGNYVKVVQRVPVKIIIDDVIPADHPVGPGLSVVPTVKVR